MREDAPITSTRLVLVPAVITLAITLLRLVGELQNWSPRFFSRAAGGGAAVVGISWLVPLFGLWFGWKLARAGRGPRAVGRAFGLTIAALVLLPALGFAAAKLGIGQQSLTTLFVYVGGSIVGIAIGLAAWPELGRTLLVYALAARVPVALVMLAAIFGN